MPDRPYHHGNLRTALLERAGEVIDAEGIDALSVRQLARDVGVSHGASARHFRDKQALLDALAVEGYRRLNATMAAAADSPAPFTDRFRTLSEEYVRFAVEHPSLLGVMYSAKHHPEASDDLVQLSGLAMNGLVDLMAEAQASDQVRRNAPPADQALIAFAAVHGVATLAMDDLLNGVPWQTAAARTIDFLLAGICPP